MSERKINEIIVRTTSEGEIEITQYHLKNDGREGIFIYPEQIDMLLKLLETSAADLEDAH